MRNVIRYMIHITVAVKTVRLYKFSGVEYHKTHNGCARNLSQSEQPHYRSQQKLLQRTAKVTDPEYASTTCIKLKSL